MNSIKIKEREISEEEYKQVVKGFQTNELSHTGVIQTSERHEFVIMKENELIGCASSLVYKNGPDYNGWAYLTDLFIVKQYRGQGLGRRVLKKLEEKLHMLGVNYIWTWTAGFEAPDFYKKQGYMQFCELENYYLTGNSRIGMRKLLNP